MKNFIFLLSIFMCGCESNAPRKPIQYKYQLGDVACMKIDDRKVIIIAHTGYLITKQYRIRTSIMNTNVYGNPYYPTLLVEEFELKECQ